MTTYFFDRVGRSRAEYDYKGRAFTTPDKARQLAELIALDLELESEGAWCGWSVDVRNAHGQKFFSIPVGAAEMLAA